MNAGNLDRRITIQQPTISRGETGGHEESWATLAIVWANIRDLNGREVFAAQAVNSAVSRVVTIRYLVTVNDSMRVLFADGKTARISWMREVGRREYMELYCERNDG